jgi:phage terminase Nu1 subunit (DNA packaging protein)
MKLKAKIDMVIGEKLMCGRCGKWFADQYAGVYVDDDDLYELLCEKCQKEIEEKENAEKARYANKEQEVIQLLRQAESSGDRVEADRIRLILLEGIRTSMVDKSDANKTLNRALYKAVSE